MDAQAATRAGSRSAPLRKSDSIPAFPDKLPDITLCQGHAKTNALRYYLNISFTADEREAIKNEVKGGGCL
jgi:hypothetical protein